MQQPREWFHDVMEQAAKTLVQNVVTNPQHSRYITDAEVGLIRQGVDRGILRIDGNLFRLSNKGQYDAFTLNREYFIQFATFTSLIVDYGYPTADCAFEYHLMDICIFQKGRPYIYVETKVSDHPSRKLIEELSNTYGNQIIALQDQPDRGIDALRKAKYIFRDRPEYFSVINPMQKYHFQVEYSEKGFSLEKIADLPKYERR